MAKLGLPVLLDHEAVKASERPEAIMMKGTTGLKDSLVPSLVTIELVGA